MERSAMNDRWSLADLAAAAIAFAAGATTAFVDTHSREVQLPAAMLLLFAAALGLARPRLAWVWAILIGGWLPLAAFTGVFGPATGPGDNSPGHVGYLLPIAIAMIGAYAGAGAAHVARLVSPGAGTAR
jgi:hypothetical protein